jgi:hypothetical protein
VFALILIQQITPGSSEGLLALGVTSLSILMGLLQVTGFVAAIVFCFAIGIYLVASATVPPPAPTQTKKVPPSDIIDLCRRKPNPNTAASDAEHHES